MLNQTQKFPSKKGFVIYIPLIILIAVEVGFLAGGLYPGAVLILIIMSALILPMFFNTYYEINDGGILKIKCGLLFNLKIPVGSITKVEKTNSILSAPALSMDRMEIFYNKFDSVVISPADRTGFVAELQKLNPDISYQL